MSTIGSALLEDKFVRENLRKCDFCITNCLFNFRRLFNMHHWTVVRCNSNITVCEVKMLKAVFRLVQLYVVEVA